MDRTVCNINIIRRFNIIVPFVHPAAQASTCCISTNNAGNANYDCILKVKPNKFGLVWFYGV